LPAGALPAWDLPSGALPGGTLPSGASPAGQLPDPWSPPGVSGAPPAEPPAPADPLPAADIASTWGAPTLGGAAPGPVAALPATLPTTADELPAADLGVPSSAAWGRSAAADELPAADIAVPSAPVASWGRPAGGRTAAPVGPRGGTVLLAATVAVGRRFQPLPGTPLPRVGQDGTRLVAPGGTPVHAMGAGVVSRAEAGVLRLRTDEGLEIGYARLAPGSITVADGARVPAGAVLGAVAPGTANSPAYLLLAAWDANGPVDSAALLLGLPDPAERGYAPADDGLGVDPDALDRELAPGPVTA
jgi:murein DD-endopeptidase MepM/ murein hydrolase activator NlpD